MENNPEYERAEAELDSTLREERIRKNYTRKKYSLSDYILSFAILVHFLAAIVSPLIFVCMLISISEGPKIPQILLWLVFPAGLVSLGTAIGLFRILLLPKSLME